MNAHLFMYIVPVGAYFVFGLGVFLSFYKKNFRVGFWNILFAVITVPFTAIYLLLASIPIFSIFGVADDNGHGVVFLLVMMMSFNFAPAIAPILGHAGWFLGNVIRR